jgi:hypothetical protein
MRVVYNLQVLLARSRHELSKTNDPEKLSMYFYPIDIKENMLEPLFRVVNKMKMTDRNTAINCKFMQQCNMLVSRVAQDEADSEYSGAEGTNVDVVLLLSNVLAAWGSDLFPTDTFQTLQENLQETSPETSLEPVKEILTLEELQVVLKICNKAKAMAE